MQVHTATFIASSISGISLLVCLLVCATIYNDVSQIWAEFDAEIDSFRSSTDELWTDILALGRSGVRLGRERRAASDYEKGGSSSKLELEAAAPTAGHAPGTPTGVSSPGVPPSLASGGAGYFFNQFYYHLLAS